MVEKEIRCSLCSGIVKGTRDTDVKCECSAVWKFRKGFAYAETKNKIFMRGYDPVLNC